MALVVETGSGMANAESYASVAEADAYHVAHSASAVWSAALTADKERCLRLATQYLDIRYGLRWVGLRANLAQALDWPRSSARDVDSSILGGISDCEGFVLPSTQIPPAVKAATAEAALRFLSGQDLLTDLSNPAGVRESSVNVGPVTETTVYFQPNGPTAVYQVIDGLLRKLVRTSGELRRA